MTAIGLVGDGTTVNNTTMQSILTAAGTAGGSITIPCGSYNFTNISTITTSIAAGKNLTLAGSGVDCTELNFTNSAGLAFTGAGVYSSLIVRDLTFKTDQTGTFDAITFSIGGLNVNPALSAQSIVSNVNFLGSDSYSGTPTKYWRNGYSETNVSNINISNVMYTGPAGQNGGNIISLLGLVGSCGYSVAINISNLTGELQGSCVNIGDYVQGVTMRSMNCTNGINGVLFPASAAGVLGEFIISESQFGGNTGKDINVRTPNANVTDVKLSDDLFIDSGTGGGIVIGGSRPSLSQLNFTGTSSTVPAIIINGSVGTITGGTIVGYSTGITYGPASHDIVQTGTKMSANTVDYSFDASAVNIVVNDMNQRTFATLPTCGAANSSSTFSILDATAPTYNGAITGGGAVAVTAKCVGSIPAWRSQ